MNRVLDLNLVQDLEIDPRPDPERKQQKDGEDKPILIEIMRMLDQKKSEEMKKGTKV